MARKNNKRNRRRAAFYGINPFDYEAREKLAADQPPLPEETSKKEEAVIKLSLVNEWTEVWAPKIIVVQTTSRKAQADVFEHFKGLEVRIDLKDKRQ